MSTPNPVPTTNVPAIQWVNGMPVVPTEQAILAGRQADFVAAFGSGLNVAPTTPQGQVIASDTAIIGDKNADIALIANQVDPDQSEGAFQDAIGAIYFQERIAASGSVKTITVIGAVNTTIPAGALIQDPSGFLWGATGAITIPSSGQTSGTFQNTTTGPIAWPGNTPATIITQVNGWDQATSSSAAALGRNVESRAAFENRRRNSVAINSHGTTDTIKANVLAVTNVLSAFVIDNPENEAVTVGTTNFPVAPHSILVSVFGGLASAIAEAIWTGKDGGCGYNGNTTFTIADTSYPVGSQPQYPVTFQTANPTPLYFVVTLQNNASLPSNIATPGVDPTTGEPLGLVQAAVLATFNGTDAAGSVPAGIGLTISGSRYSTQINLISAAVNIENIQVALQTVVASESIGTANGTTATFTHTAANLSVVPGTVTITAGSVVATDDGAGNLTGAGIAAGSTINYSTGVVSITYSTDPPNATAITMAYSFASPTSGIVTMGVDQMPTLVADSVVVVLAS
jgi:Baseplate J-like protein